MNYITQIKGFWIAQEAYQLGTSEIALYFYLLEVGNKTGWTGTFKRNNYKVMVDLSIRSHKTLQSLRDKLVNSGVIQFNQKNGDANVEYILIDLGKKYQGEGEGDYQGSGKGKGKGSGKVNINKTKLNKTLSKSHSDADAPAKKKKEIDFWDSLVEVWFDFYEKNFSTKPIFNAQQGNFLKKIISHLKKISEQSGRDWTEEYAKRCLLGFFVKAWNKDEWMRKNFELNNLLLKINSITNQNEGAVTKPKQATGNRKSAGAINIARELAKEAGIA